MLNHRPHDQPTAGADHEISRTQLSPDLAVAVHATVPIAELPTFFAGAFSELAKAVQAAGAHVVSAPFARYYTTPPGPIDVEAVLPVNKPVPAHGRVAPLHLEAGPAIEALHVGPYDQMGPLYADFARFMAENGMEASGPPREVYLTDPGTSPDPATWRTMLVQPTRMKRTEAHRSTP